ncbi:hypothetical protein [Thiobacillus sp.]|uniref:hypothetical protein n=1 Tax=Thiobacillus sp. TaxID=924 RepID=UPI0011D7E89F|nr:hypothetical protein [Thiobacillus sp.]TXH74433.1 MAG: hypothetical protein E6Q82_10235 [Thiobacillus sp.]
MRQPLRYIHSISNSPNSGVRLAHALYQLGRMSLLIDTRGRLFTSSSLRSLFDWRHQLERRQLHALPQAYCEAWYAPGMRADEPALPGMVGGYDDVIFDSEWDCADLALLPDVAHTVVMEIRRTDESMRKAYAVLKTLARSGVTFRIGLLGDRLACDHIQAAGCHFLGHELVHAIFNVANENDAFAALAVRMADEERA